MKKLLEIECCSECPHSNMATTACMFDGEEKDLPDNVLFDRIIPEWCKLESKTLTDSVTYEQITNKARELYGKDLQKRSIFIKGAIFASTAITELESKLSQPVLTDEEIKTEASKYAVERHGVGGEWQPDREESALGFIEGAKFYRDKQKGS